MPFKRADAIKALHAEGRTKGFDHDALKDICASLTNIPRDKITLAFTPKDKGKIALTNPQLATCVASLKGTATGAPMQIMNKASVRQLWYIKQQALKLGWIESEKISNHNPPERLAGFLERQAKKRSLSDLTPQDAQKVIDGLKNLIQRGISSSAK